MMSDPMLVDDLPQSPPAHRAEDEVGSAGEADAPTPSQGVHFHSEISIHYVSQPQDDRARNELYYSEQDIDAFRLLNRRDVVAAYRRHCAQQSAPSSNGGEEGECDITGIENVCTPQLAKNLSARRKGCVDAVLDEQERQDELGYYDAEELARASRQFSGYAGERARNIGTLHRLSCSGGNANAAASSTSSSPQASPTRRSSETSATELLASNRLAPRMLTRLLGLM